MVSVGPFQQVPFDVLLHGVQKVLVVSDVNVEGCERLLALVSLKRQQEEDETNGQHFQIWRFLFLNACSDAFEVDRWRSRYLCGHP